MKTSEWYWKSKDGLEMCAQLWAPDDAPKAVVILVHGLGEHIGRYAHVAAALNEAGYVLAGYDLRGHGRSGGPRGYTPSYDALMDDTAQFIDLLAGRHPGLPHFLYGHSMDGNLIINFALSRRAELVG